MRNIFISDIHGYYDEFQELLKVIEFSKNDVLYVLGDMINDGDYSFEVLLFMRSLGSQCRAILGNHEVSLLSNIERRASFEDRAPLPDYERELARRILWSPDMLSYLQSLPHYIEEPGFIGVHRGLIPGIPFGEQKDILGNSEQQERIHLDWYQSYTGTKPVIYGHWGSKVHRQNTHFESFDENGRLKSVCIDGGIKEMEGKLAAFILEENMIVDIRGKELS